MHRRTTMRLLLAAAALAAPAAAQPVDVESWTDMEVLLFGSERRDLHTVFPPIFWTIEAGPPFADFDLVDFVQRAYRPFANRVLDPADLLDPAAMATGGTMSLEIACPSDDCIGLLAVPAGLVRQPGAELADSYSFQARPVGRVARLTFAVDTAGIEPACRAVATSHGGRAEVLAFPDGSLFGHFNLADPAAGFYAAGAFFGPPGESPRRVTITATALGFHAMWLGEPGPLVLPDFPVTDIPGAEFFSGGIFDSNFFDLEVPPEAGPALALLLGRAAHDFTLGLDPCTGAGLSDTP